MIRPASRLAISVAFALLAGTALAQQQAPEPSQSHIAAAREVAVSSGLTRSFDSILPQFGEQIRQSAVSRPELTKDLDQVLEQLKPELELQKQQMITTAARIFTTRMNEQELKETAAFFKSASGQKYVQMQPLVLDEIVREMETWTNGVAEYVMIRVRAEMGKRGHQLQ